MRKQIILTLVFTFISSTLTFADANTAYCYMPTESMVEEDKTYPTPYEAIDLLEKDLGYNAYSGTPLDELTYDERLAINTYVADLYGFSVVSDSTDSTNDYSLPQQITLMYLYSTIGDNFFVDAPYCPVMKSKSLLANTLSFIYTDLVRS